VGCHRRRCWTGPRGHGAVQVAKVWRSWAKRQATTGSGVECLSGGRWLGDGDISKWIGGAVGMAGWCCIRIFSRLLHVFVGLNF
jgi:hypothetical protein